MEFDALVLDILTVLVAAALVYATWNLFRATNRRASIEKREAERRRILADMDMYQDIAQVNRWEWSPYDVDERDSRYRDWDQWRERCIRYSPRIYDPTMMTFYTEFVKILRKQQGRDRWGVIVASLRKEADSRIIELRARLERIDKSDE